MVGYWSEKFTRCLLFFSLQSCRYAILSIKNGMSDTARDEETMSQYEKLLLAILSGTRDKNFLFSDLRLVLERLEVRPSPLEMISVSLST